MQLFTDVAPVLAFFISYYIGGLYVATGVLMAAMIALLAVDWLRLRRIPPLHGLSAVLVLLFGSATLLLHDRQFIQWKPTVFFWLAGLVFLGSQFIGQRTLTERLLGNALESQVRVSERTWRVLNVQWVVFYAFLGGLNLLVAWHASERAWVNFKFFGLTLLTAAFVMVQLLWVSRRSAAPPEPSPP